MPPILMPPIIMATAVFFEKPHDLIRAPLVAKIGKRSNGDNMETIFSKFKLSKTILAQLMNWDQCIVIYYNIPVHKFGQNYISKA